MVSDKILSHVCWSEQNIIGNYCINFYYSFQQAKGILK